LKTNLLKFFETSLLSDITETRIEVYKQSQLGAGVRAAGVNRNLSFLRLVLKKARRERYIAQNALNDSELFMNERKERLQARPFHSGGGAKAVVCSEGLSQAPNSASGRNGAAGWKRSPTSTME